MADRDPVWVDGESQLIYSPTSALDVAWVDGECIVLDAYSDSVTTILPIVMAQFRWRKS
jgi:hypothetical protein